MGNGYNHHLTLNFHQKTPFLPMLCSNSSMKDQVVLPRSKTQSNSTSNDPLSPKIGCMGQVKRHNNKITNFPTSNNKITIFSSSSSSFSPLPPLKYSKLKRMFSAKNPNANPGFCRRKGESFHGGRRSAKIDFRTQKSKSSVSVVNLDEIDPPLPVIKKVAKDGSRENVDSLWKRRSNGIGLKNLQLQQLQISTNNLAPTTI